MKTIEERFEEVASYIDLIDNFTMLIMLFAFMAIVESLRCKWNYMIKPLGWKEMK